MPGTVAQSEIMQATGDFHHYVADRVLPVAHFLLDNATALHTAHRMLNPHLLARNPTIIFLLLRCQFATAWFLCRLLHTDVRYCKSLKSHILIQDTPSRQRVRFIIDNRFLMPFPSMCATQKPHHTVCINQQDVFDRMTSFLSTVIFGLFIRIYWPLDGTFGAIMIKKGA